MGKKGKFLFSWLLLVLALLVMLSCAKKDGGTTSTPADEKVNLRLSFWFGAADLPAWQRGMDEYTAAHPNVTFTVESTPWADYWTKLKSQVAADAQADITGMVSMQSKFFIRNGALLNLSPFIEKENFAIDDFWPGIMQAYIVDGGVYCLPYDLSSALLLCNLDLFDAAGVEFKPEGYTMEEFVEVSKKLTNDNHYASYWYQEASGIYEVLLSGGVDPVDASGNIDINKPEAIEMLQWLADLYLVHGTNARFDRGGTDGASLFQAGRVAMYPVNPEWVMKIKSEMPNARLDVMDFPFLGASNRSRSVTGGAFAVSSKTKYPDIAWDFLKNYTSQEQLSSIVGATHRGIPGRISSAQTMLTSQYAVPHSQLFFDVLENSKNIDYPFMAECEIELIAIMDRVWLGEITAKDAVQQFMNAVTEFQN